MSSLRKKLESDFVRYKSTGPSVKNVIYLILSNPGFRAVFLYRLGKNLKQKKHRLLPGLCQRLMHHFCHCYISINADIGPGFLISHVGGIVIGGKTVIGKNCDIRQNTTLGGNYRKINKDGRTQPLVRDNVSIGAGAVIVGPILIKSNAIIGANSMVNRDVSEGAIMLGVPAKIVKYRDEFDPERRL
jgi:serine O-acetyltransferase